MITRDVCPRIPGPVVLGAIVSLLSSPALAQEPGQGAAPPPRAADAHGPGTGETAAPAAGPPPASGPSSRPVKRIWYYQMGQRVVGPVTAEEIRGLFRSGQLTAQHRVTQGGAAAWTYLGLAPELGDLVQWFVVQRGVKHGPYSGAQIHQQVRTGLLGPADQVWRKGLASWSLAGELPELREALPAATGQKRAGEPGPPEGSPPETVTYRDLAGWYLEIGGFAGSTEMFPASGIGGPMYGARISAAWVVRHFFHLGCFATFTRLEPLDEGEDYYIRGVNGANDLALGVTLGFGSQLGSSAWVGFSLDIGGSPLRAVDLEDTSRKYETSSNFYMAPNAVFLFLFGEGATRVGLKLALTTPIFIGDYMIEEEGFLLWAGVNVSTALVVGFGGVD